MIVAHADDETIGAGGTIARLVAMNCAVQLLVIGDGVSSRRSTDKSTEELISRRESSCRRAMEELGVEEIKFLRLMDNSFDTYSLLEICQRIEDSVVNFSPNTIITHTASELNLDHQLTNRAVHTACRPSVLPTLRQILCFPVASSYEWTFNVFPQAFKPQIFVDIETTRINKINALTCYENELREPPHPRSLREIDITSAYFGSRVMLEYAEAFELSWVRI